MNPAHHGSTPSSPLTMEPSHPYPVDSVHPSPAVDAIESIRIMYERIDPVKHTDPLFSFVVNQLHKMTIPSEAASSSAEGGLETVWYDRDLAAKTIEIICTEAEKLSQSDSMKAMERLTLRVMEGVGEFQAMNGVGEMHYWVFIGLSVAAFAVERYMSVGSTENRCRGLLLKILQLAKDVKHYSQEMADERETLRDAVTTIVEGAVICCDHLEKNFRFWSATTAAAQLGKTKEHLQEHLRDFQWRKDYVGDKDVFLSHSGEQKNFVRQVHRELSTEHVNCFFDQDRKSLPLAKKFAPLIFKAAETCKIAVMVISREFIRSKWPMLELSAFCSAITSGKNAKLQLFPIFFKISPNELSHITKDSPEWHELPVENDTRIKWEDALKEVRSINGLHFSEGGNENDFRDLVVKEIRGLVKRITPIQLLDFKSVGIEEQVRQVKAKLDMEGAQSALAVIVCGFAGVGKTTVAASAVQSLDWSSTDFKFCKVAIDEKIQDRASHIIKLQKDILDNLGEGKGELRDPLDGRLKITEAFKKKCSLLLFIDNVVDKGYIRDLLPKDLPFPEQKTKLRIILTSRDKTVKAELDIMWKEYEVIGLSDADSESLLLQIIVNSHHEVGDIRLDEERMMINEVAAACRGVPLLLSVFGNHLRVHRIEDYYQEALGVLKEGNVNEYRGEDLGEKLMFVYNKIKNGEVKEAFVDICTYYHGWDWNVVVDIVGFSELDHLRRISFVSNSGRKVVVHDILRLIGMKEGGLTRFSNHEELSHALENHSVDLRNVKGISVVNDTGLITIQSAQLEAMHKSLRVLMLGDWVILDGSPCDRAFTNLRYLRVGDIAAFPFKDPSKLLKLKVFLNRSEPGMNLSSLPSSLKRISHETPEKCNKFSKLPFQNLSSLKSLIVHTWKFEPVELPEEFHLPPSLVDLDLTSCNNIPKDIGHLTALESLILDRSELKCLPQRFGKLKKLKHLSMKSCSELASLSEELGMLSSLEAISMEYCRKLRALPQSFGDLRIQELNLESLSELNKLPNSFGNMPLLKDRRLECCYSLMSLPDGFVQLKMLETLKIFRCSELSNLPKDFGLLRYLKHMTVDECNLLKELPKGFETLPALKTFILRNCKNFVNLPREFTQLTGLEELRLEGLPLISRIPDGFGNFKILRFLYLVDCFQLKILSDDFENMATLERLVIRKCPKLDGAMMEKIVKLRQCYMADIDGSDKLLKKWSHMQSEKEYLMAVLGGRRSMEARSFIIYSAIREAEENSEAEEKSEAKENVERAIRVALLHGKCVQLNENGQLMERSSLLVGLEEGTTATVALIMLPIHMQSYQPEMLQGFVEMARKRAETSGSGKLRFVCARKYAWTDQRATPTEEGKEDIRQMLLLLPKGSYAIPSSECKRVKVITSCCDHRSGDWDCYKYQLSFFMANVMVAVEGRKSFEDSKFTWEHQMPRTGRRYENIQNCRPVYNSIQNFIKSICGERYQSQSQSVAGQSKTAEFIEALKGNGMHYLLIPNNNNISKVMVDDLYGKTIGFILCDRTLAKCIKLQQFFKDLQKEDSNFMAIWIPRDKDGWHENQGYGSYMRLIQCMPWATFPNPKAIWIDPSWCKFHSPHNISEDDHFVLLDKEGQIVN